MIEIDAKITDDTTISIIIEMKILVLSERFDIF
jgi:hypothetical protein